ncbi:hypothetical protein EUX98_g4662 [Antrodiella citrinella]|uniref:Uncharacterized protein n=1 Tax=Antrodiella citrinella TaxID=2447956 RepID=A0A4S4MUB1_9APHY|nr:hypothetical protein EUX98_g4662 [Antrodiella citrinella]
MVDTSRTHIRAGLGLHDLLRTPAVDIPACVGLRQPSNGAAPVFINGDGDSQPQASTSKTAPVSAKVTDYLVGTQLDDAVAAGQDITVYWPFAEGGVSDWIQAEALCYERLCQMFFERFNVAGFAVIDRPMAQFYATITGQDLSGVIVDIGQDFTDITPIHDGFPVHNARAVLKYGISDCERYLAHLLRSNQGVISALSPPSAESAPEDLDRILVELSRQIWKEGLVKVLAEGEAADIEEEGVTDIAAVLVAGKEKTVIESGMKKRANAKASAAEQARAREIEALDLVTIQFKDMSLTLGKERHRFCEPLFDPALLSILPGQVEPDYRQYVWQGLLVTGELTNQVKGLGAALQTRLAPFLLSNVDQLNEVQPKAIKVLKIPDYFAEYREKGDGLASFLGASVVAKISFTDNSGKNFVSKADYTSLGPSAILEMSPMII